MDDNLDLKVNRRTNSISSAPLQPFFPALFINLNPGQQERSVFIFRVIPDCLVDQSLILVLVFVRKQASVSSAEEQVGLWSNFKRACSSSETAVIREVQMSSGRIKWVRASRAI